MTGFGKGEAGSDNYQVTVEIKSVNHRFKDIRFKMSSMFSSIELDLKKELGKIFNRGSFEIYVSYKKAEKKFQFDDLDSEKINSFISKMSGISTENAVNISFNACDFLRNEFYKDRNESVQNELQALVKQAFGLALDSLKDSRLQEGEKLINVINNHKETYLEHYSNVKNKAPEFENVVKERVLKKFNEYEQEIKVDEPRFLQEVIYYLEKLDVHEEINRIEAHISKLTTLLDSNGEIGRQIDFLIQELNRETNTIGSKSGVESVSNAVVQMKVQLEKIREQGLNIE